MAMAAMPGMSMSMGETSLVRFPFVFPVPGDYRVFVQIKTAGLVETAAFDVGVH
jgi:hypothetical protein